jgi:hypothetical protein
MALASSVQEFDYVIVGSGTARLVVATRLTEDERVRIEVLEAGRYVPPGEEPRIDLIVNYGLVFGDPKYDWNLKSVPQDWQEGLDGALNICAFTLNIYASTKTQWRRIPTSPSDSPPSTLCAQNMHAARYANLIFFCPIAIAQLEHERVRAFSSE